LFRTDSKCLSHSPNLSFPTRCVQTTEAWGVVSGGWLALAIVLDESVSRTQAGGRAIGKSVLGRAHVLRNGDLLTAITPIWLAKLSHSCQELTTLLWITKKPIFSKYLFSRSTPGLPPERSWSAMSMLREVPIKISFGDLAVEHLAAFDQALLQPLSTQLAKRTFAQIIDGLPTNDMYDGNLAVPQEEIWGHLEPSANSVEAVKDFRKRFRSDILQFC
jgi:hypothetical protein